MNVSVLNSQPGTVRGRRLGRVGQARGKAGGKVGRWWGPVCGAHCNVGGGGKVKGRKESVVWGSRLYRTSRRKVVFRQNVQAGRIGNAQTREPGRGVG